MLVKQNASHRTWYTVSQDLEKRTLVLLMLLL